MSLKRRIEELGLREDRADVIFPAAAVYGRLMEIARAEEILVPFVGVKEGLVEDILIKIGGIAQESRQTWDVAVNLGRKYQF